MVVATLLPRPYASDVVNSQAIHRPAAAIQRQRNHPDNRIAYFTRMDKHG